MLTTVEKVLFFLLAVVSLYAAYVTFGRMIQTIQRGQGQIAIGSKGRFVVDFMVNLLNQGGIIHRRRVASMFHYAVAWGFVFYGLVNLLDVVEGYVTDFHFLGDSTLGGLYRLAADVFSVAVLIGVAGLWFR